MLSDVPVRHGHIELGGAVTKLRGPEAWLEGVYRPHQRFGLFGRGFINPEDHGAMLGARWTF